MLSPRIEQRIGDDLHRARATLVSQPSAAAPGWSAFRGGDLDLGATSSVLLNVDLHGSANGEHASRLALDWIEDRIGEFVDHGSHDDDHALAVSALLRHRPASVLGQLGRERLLGQSDRLSGQPALAVTRLLVETPRTAALDALLVGCLARAQELVPDSLPAALEVLETYALTAEFAEIGHTGRAAARFVLSAMDPHRHCWCDVDGEMSVLLSSRALRALTCTSENVEGLAHVLPHAAEAICKRSLKGVDVGGWGSEDHRVDDHDIVDNRATAEAIGALTALLVKARPTRLVGAPREQRVVDLLYAPKIEVRLDAIPATRPYDNTMFTAVDSYSEKTLTTDELGALLQSGGRIEVHGTYPTHLPALIEGSTITDLELLVDRTENQRLMATTKRFNNVRPHFYQGTDPSGRRVLFVGAGCGEDYVLHYASMLRHVWHNTTRAEPRDRLRIVRYPQAEQDIAYWTGLDQSFVHAGDRVVLGYVEECRDRLGGAAATVASYETEFYGADTIYDGKGRRVTFLGVKFSFWGSISFYLAARLCELGISELLYIGKLGALSSKTDLYEQLFVPSRFAKLRHDQVEYIVDPSPANGVLEAMPLLDTGMHVSIPTVLEEDYAQREQTTLLNAQSIDNEISQIARAVADHNASRGATVKFSAIHFATDYIRRDDERSVETRYDLANARTPDAQEARERMLDRIAHEVVVPYLGLRGGLNE